MHEKPGVIAGAMGWVVAGLVFALGTTCFFIKRTLRRISGANRRHQG